MLILKSVNFEQQKFHHHRLKPTQPGQVEWMIGRSTNCDLVLSSPEVSRTHARIIYTDDNYHFTDVGSTSGSLINGTPISAHEQCPLEVGDLLQLGETFLYVEELQTPDLTQVDNKLSLGWWQPDQPWQGDIVCQCCRIVNETADVKTFYFTADPPMLFSYKPGQFVNLEVEIDGQTVIRPYSISSSPSRPYHLSLTVKRVPPPVDRPDLPAGLVSNWLHDQLRVGDRLKFLGGPLGQFTCLPDIPQKVLLISAGSGITPMMSMSRWIQDTLTHCDVIFLHSARTVEDIIFRPDLEAIAAQMPNFRLAITLTQAPIGQAWMGMTGRISEEMMRMVAPDLMDRSVYVCGPNGFMQQVRSVLETMQFPMENYQEESFGAPMTPNSKPLLHPSPDTIDDSTGSSDSQDTIGLTTIYFSQSDQTISTSGEISILDLAEDIGVPIRSACRMGGCGACKVKICQGDVQYLTAPTALTESDQEAGYALACVAYATQDLVIDA